MAHLITGYAGYEHIKSADQGNFNASFFGAGQFVMEIGEEFDASIIDNNTVRVLDGSLLMYGRHIMIDADTYEDLTISTGTAGMNRNDLIVMEYSKNADTGVESAALKVIKGTETSGDASDPEYTNGNILEGATLNQMPLYRIKVEGVVLTEAVKLFDTVGTYEDLAEKYEAEFKTACQNYLGSLNILDSKAEIEANTQENQLAGALGVKEISAEVNTLNSNLTADDNLEFNFSKDSDGNYGFLDLEGNFMGFGNVKNYDFLATLASRTTSVGTLTVRSFNQNLCDVTSNIISVEKDCKIKIYGANIYTSGTNGAALYYSLNSTNAQVTIISTSGNMIWSETEINCKAGDEIYLYTAYTAGSSGNGCGFATLYIVE